MKCVVLYRSAPDMASKAPVHFAAHLAWYEDFIADGSLLMIGPFGDPQAEGAMGVFRTRAAAERFVAGDPFIKEGVVEGYELRDWNEVLVPDA